MARAWGPIHAGALRRWPSHVALRRIPQIHKCTSIKNTKTSLKKQKTFEFCSQPYCGALIPQSVNRHLDAGRLINFFIWQSSCCQLHTSVPARDKITFPIKMNTHASAFLLGRFPPQCCGVACCHVLKSLRLDVVLSFHMQLSRSSRPDIVWVLPWW